VVTWRPQNPSLPMRAHVLLDILDWRDCIIHPENIAESYTFVIDRATEPSYLASSRGAGPRHCDHALGMVLSAGCPPGWGWSSVRFCQGPDEFGPAIAPRLTDERRRGTPCIECGSAAVTERSERSARGYRRLRCRICGRQFKRTIRHRAEPDTVSVRRHRPRRALALAPQVEPAGLARNVRPARDGVQSRGRPELGSETRPGVGRGTPADRLTTDGHDSYPRASRSELGGAVRHGTNRYLNNGLEQDHRGIKGRDRPMRGFQCPRSAARFEATTSSATFSAPCRYNQHAPAGRRRLLFLSRTVTVLGILQAA
jgi:DDE domain